MNDNSTFTVQIKTQGDLAQLRNTIRRMMQEIYAPVYEQSRVSWMIDYIGRQVLSFGHDHALQISQIASDDDQQLGLQVVCKGAWLRPMGYFYARHLLIPHLTDKDVVDYVDGHSPQLTITAWVERAPAASV